MCAKVVDVDANNIFYINNMNAKSSLDIIKNKDSFTTMKLVNARKEPTHEYKMEGKRYVNKYLWEKKTLKQLFLNQNKENRGILTGKLSDVVVVDLDFYDHLNKKEYKKLSEEDRKNKDKVDKLITPFDRTKSKFLKDFGEDFVKKFDTLTFKTANGGTHLIFKYNPIIKTTTNDLHSIDIRSDGGYIVAPGSVIDRSVYNKSIKNDKKGFYMIEYDTTIKDMSIELITWLSMNLTNNKRVIHKPLKKVSNGDVSNTEVYDQDEVDLTEYKYTFTDDILCKVLDGLDNDFFIDNDKWYVFTTAMKTIGKKDLWDKYSKEKGGDKYDYDENCKRYWENAKHKTLMCLEHILSNSSFVDDPKTFLGYFKMKPTDIHNTETTKELEDRQYLDINNDGKFFYENDKRFTLVRSDTGTGKTTAFKNYIKKTNRRFISIVSRVSLGLEQEKVFKRAGIDCIWHDDITKPTKEIEEQYSDSPYPIGWWMFEGQNIITTIDSVIKMVNWRDFNDYVLYLDEYNSLIEYFVDCPNLCNKRISVWKQFNKMIEEADRVIMTDADISDNSINFIKGIKDIRLNEIEYINNPYKHNSGKKATELFNYKDLIKLISEQTLGAMICLDSKNVGEKLVDDLKEKYGIDVKYYSSDTTEQIDLDAHKFVAFSPKVVYGLDSLMTRPVFCYYKCQTISPVAMVQQVNRNRNITHLYYLFESKTWKSYKYDTIDECIYEIKEGQKVMKDYYLAFEMNNDDNLNERFNNLLASFRYTLDCYSTNKFAHFLDIIQRRGFTITNFMDFNEGSVKKSNGFLTQLKKELQQKKEGEIQEILDKNIDFFKSWKSNIILKGNYIYKVLMRYSEGTYEDKLDEIIKREKEDKEFNILKHDDELEGYMISKSRLLELYEKDEDVKDDLDHEIYWWLDKHRDGNKIGYTGNNDDLVINELIKERCKKLLNRINLRVQEIILEGEKLALNQLPPHFLKIINLLEIPYEELLRPEINILIRDPQALEKYFKVINYFTKDSEKLKQEICKRDDFDSQKYNASNSQFILLNKLKNGVGLYECQETKKLLIKNIMDKDVAEKLQKEYSITFRNRSKKLDFKDPQHVKTTIIRIYKLLFGDDIIGTQQTSTSVNGKTKKITNHYINHEYLEICNEVRTWRGGNKYSYECLGV
jgi:hypothetical protein